MADSHNIMAQQYRLMADTLHVLARQEGYDLRTVIHVIKERGIIDRPPYLAVVKRAYQVPEGMPPRDFRVAVFEKCVTESR